MHDYKDAQKHLQSIKMNPRNWSNLLITAEALARGVAVTKRRDSDGLVLTYNGKQFRWHQGKNNLNTRLAGTATRYKDVTSRLFLNQGVQAPENCAFAANQEERAWRWAESLLPVVVKPNSGTQGRAVHVGVKSREEFHEAFVNVAGDDNSPVLVEQFHEGIEHRCLVVDKKLIAVTRRMPANVVGDGVSTIRELVDGKNQDRGRIHKRLKLESHELKKLVNERLSASSVPASEQVVFLRETSNLHTGGDAHDATDTVTAEERAFVERACAALPGLRLAGLDVLLPREGQGKRPVVIEANLHPMTSMHHFPWSGQPRNVTSAILDAMFPQTTER